MTSYPVDGAEAIRFVSQLWPAGIPYGYYFTCWTLQDRTCFPMESPEARNIERIAAGADTYYHVGLTKRVFRGNKSRPGTSDIELLPALWLDLDAKNGVTFADLNEYLTSCFPKPSIVVNTGHGYHAYWLLKQPETAARVKAVEEGFTRWHQQQAAFHIDSLYDMARVLRLPGTWNYKDTKCAEKCRIIHVNDVRYDLSELPVLEAPMVTRPELPVIIGESQGPYDGRDKTLFKLLCAMRRFNCPEEWLATAATAINAAHFSPPLTDREVARKVSSALRYAPQQKKTADVTAWLEGN